MAHSALLQNQLAHASANFSTSALIQQLFDTPHEPVPQEHINTKALLTHRVCYFLISTLTQQPCGTHL